jgi:hypothetical protein
MKKHILILMLVLVTLVYSNKNFAQALESTTASICTTQSMKMKKLSVVYHYTDSANADVYRYATLTPAFDSSTTNYTVTVPLSKKISSWDVSANSVVSNFPFIINGKRPTILSGGGSNAVWSVTGVAANSNQFIIENRSPDLKYKMTYTVNVIRN